MPNEKLDQRPGRCFQEGEFAHHIDVMTIIILTMKRVHGGHRTRTDATVIVVGQGVHLDSSDASVAIERIPSGEEGGGRGTDCRRETGETQKAPRRRPVK